MKKEKEKKGKDMKKKTTVEKIGKHFSDKVYSCSANLHGTFFRILGPVAKYQCWLSREIKNYET